MATKTVEGTLFEVHVKGVVTGKTWDGKFRAKPILNFREQMQADKMQREMVGTDAVNPDIITAAVILSELQFRLTETPEWWRENGNGTTLADPNLLEAIYREAQKVEKEHLDGVRAEAEKARVEVKAEGEKKGFGGQE